jgi:hypothetical protein
MQWIDDAKAGFSDARPSRLIRPVTEGRFGPMAVNVAAQRRDPDSLLNWIERIIRRRRETPEIGWGTWRVLECDPDPVLAHRCDWEGRSFVAVHNLAADPFHARIDLGPELPDEPRLIDMLDEDGAVIEADDGRLELKLDGYGFRWMRVQSTGEPVAP